MTLRAETAGIRLEITRLETRRCLVPGDRHHEDLLTLIDALLPQSAVVVLIDGRRRAVRLRFQFRRVEPVVGRHRDEQAQERGARTSGRRRRQETIGHVVAGAHRHLVLRRRSCRQS